MANRIFCRSPFYLTIVGTANDTTRVDLYIWNGTGSAPVSPQIQLSKPIPSTLITRNIYDISPYLRDYIEFTQRVIHHDSFAFTYDSDEYCNVTAKTYLNDVLVATTTYYAFDGYTFYEDEENYDRGRFLLDEGNYYYYYDSTSTTALTKVGEVVSELAVGDYIRYTNLSTLATSTASPIATAGVYTTTLVPDGVVYYPVGAKLEFFDTGNNLLRTYYSYPMEECKYTPLPLDFVNKYGVWQRQWLFKASRTSLETMGNEYKMKPNNINASNNAYNSIVGTRKMFNVNGKQSIKINTGWVDESWNDVLEQIMLSEVILLDLKPVKLNNRSTELFTHINDKLINYTLEFDYAYDKINAGF